MPGGPSICLSGEFTAACGTGQICHPVETVPDYNVAARGPIRGIRGWVHQSATRRPDENLMSTYRLKDLLSPRSGALIGASPRQASVGRAVLNNIVKAKFAGEFGLVNSAMPRSDGVAAVASLDKLPFVPELVVITAPPSAVAGLIDEADGAAPRVPSSSAPDSAHGQDRWRMRPERDRAEIRHAADRTELPRHRMVPGVSLNASFPRICPARAIWR